MSVHRFDSGSLNYPFLESCRPGGNSSTFGSGTGRSASSAGATINSAFSAGMGSHGSGGGGSGEMKPPPGAHPTSGSTVGYLE